MVFVIAVIELNAEARGSFLGEFHQVVPLVRGEEGCIEYGPTVDVPTGIPAQPEVRDNVVTVVEKWESLEALEAHLVAPHMIEYRKKVKEMITGSTIYVLEPA